MAHAKSWVCAESKACSSLTLLRRGRECGKNGAYLWALHQVCMSRSISWLPRYGFPRFVGVWPSLDNVYHLVKEPLERQVIAQTPLGLVRVQMAGRRLAAHRGHHSGDSSSWLPQLHVQLPESVAAARQRGSAHAVRPALHPAYCGGPDITSFFSSIVKLPYQPAIIKVIRLRHAPYACAVLTPTFFLIAETLMPKNCFLCQT